ncbi:MAG: restriction endonuclease subunit S [Candidatus Limiplasma sp.]|nr:restriction endonuclease subunit S [Candidatus Limiplasma sp.]
MREDIRQRIEIVRSGRVPEGYVGAIGGIFPVGWQHKPIKRVIQFYNKKSSEDNQYPILTSSRDGLYLQADYFDGQVTRDDNTGYNLIPYGYITFRSRSDDGAIIFNRNTIIDVGIVSKFYPVFTSMEREVDAAYLVLYLNNILQSEIRRVVVGSTQLVLSERKLLGLPFYAPSYVSQQQISGIILRCEHVISLKQEILVEKRNRKKWLLENLLDPDNGIRLEGFSGDWTTSSIGDAFTMLGSIPASRAQLGIDGTKYLHYGDIHSSNNYYLDVSVSSIPRLVCKKTPTNAFLMDGDVVFVDASEDYEGASKYIVIDNPQSEPIIAGLHTLGMRQKNDKFIKHFEIYMFQSNSVKKLINFYVSGMKVFGLSKVNIQKITFQYPGLKEQRAIAHVLSTADREIDLLQQEIEQWQLLKKALSQLLLTGLVRV